MEPEDFEDEKPSRSARKRQAESLQKLGVQLLTLREHELTEFDLPEALLEAIREAHRLTNRAALARQRQYIGKLMRDLDPAPIEQRLAQRAGGPRAHAKMPR